MGQSTRFGAGQITVTSSATQIAAANQDRLTITLTKLNAENVFLGCNNALTTTGGLLFAGTCGATITLATTSPIFGITVGASVTVTYGEITQ
jgi:hypothetical protein